MAHQFEPEGRVRHDQALKFQHLDGPKLWWQIETAPPVSDYPIDLHHAGENRLTVKMAVKINQIVGRNDLEERAFRIALNQSRLRLGHTRWLRFEQCEQIRVTRLALGIDRQRVEVAPDARQAHRFDGMIEQFDALDA